MFTEELNLIKDAESSADLLKKNAKTEAKTMIQSAVSKAEEILTQAEASAKSHYEALLKEGGEIAQTEYDTAMKEAHKQCDAMAAKAGEKKKQVVGTIVERIVRSSVNC